jgi:hypothetical protein
MTIHSYLQGGLGNQLFQYAAARALSERYKVDFALDKSWFDRSLAGVTHRKYQLDLLNIEKIVFSNHSFPKKPNRLEQFLQSTFSSRPFICYQRNAFSFDPSLFNLRNASNRDVYLYGYWQGFRYIEAIRPILQTELQLRSRISAHYHPFLEQISDTASVMLHIRRGDYVESPPAAQLHGVLSIAYYLNAIKAIQEIQADAHFFVFSDDLPWAKSMLPPGLPITFIDNSISMDAAAQELQLMRTCKHHIIANSSLSWWGAWLKINQNGTVFAPNRWINQDNSNLSDLLPPSWHRLPA